MRKIQLLSVIFACFFMQSMSAKDIYLSATGNDASDGLSATSAVKSLTRVNEIINIEDIVHVKGIIKITEEPDFATRIADGTQEPLNPENGIYLYHRGYFFRNALKLAGVTFLGEDSAKDGFSGEDVAPLFQFQGAAPVFFKNICFIKAVTHRAATGQYGSDVSTIWAIGSELTFENCLFEKNDIARKAESPADPIDGWGDRGCILISGGSAFFKKCDFTENLGKEGGVLFISGGDVLIEDCYFGYNNCAELNYSKGGAIYTWVHGNDGPLNLTIRKSIFEGNTARSGGAIALNDKVSYQSTYTKVLIDRCAFIGNQATEHQGGAIFWDNFMGRQSKDIVSITNSLFYGNSANDYGGALCIWNVQPNSELSMNNVTLYGNYTFGNVGHGPGLSLMTGYETYLPGNLSKKIMNCIFDGNYALGGDKGVAYADLCALYTPEEHPDLFEMKNSYVGHSVNVAGHAGISASNQIDYYTEDTYNDTFAGLDDPDYYAFNYHAIPLLENAATRTYGNAQYLVGTKDLSGKSWVIAEGNCAIGASEVNSAELDEGVIFGTAFIDPKQEPVQKLNIIDGVLFYPSKGGETAIIELYNLAGNKISKGENRLSIKGFSAGIYIASVRVGINVYKQKLIVNGN